MIVRGGNLKEVWKDIKGYEGIYQVSNLGKVRSLDRIVTYSNGAKHKHLGSIINGYISHKGYRRVELSKNGKTIKFSVHRLVAKTFLPNPKNLPQVNHKDEDKTNNRVDNLEWCTCKYNNNYGNRTKSSVQTYKHNSSIGKHVLRCDMNGNTIQEYRSTYEVEKLFGSSHSYIKHCCDENKIAYEYVWKWRCE